MSLLSSMAITFFIIAVSGIIFGIWLENKNPNVPRKNIVINRWRNVWEEFAKPRTEEDMSKAVVWLFKKGLDIGFEWAKWLLTLVALQGLAQASDSQFVQVFTHILIYIIGVYFTILVNQWINFHIHEYPPDNHYYISDKVARVFDIMMAVITMIIIVALIQSFTKAIVESVLPKDDVYVLSPSSTAALQANAATGLASDRPV